MNIKWIFTWPQVQPRKVTELGFFAYFLVLFMNLAFTETFFFFFSKNSIAMQAHDLVLLCVI